MTGKKSDEEKDRSVCMSAEGQEMRQLWPKSNEESRVKNAVRGPKTTRVIRRPRQGDHRSQTRLASPLGKRIKREMKRLEAKQGK